MKYELDNIVWQSYDKVRHIIYDIAGIKLEQDVAKYVDSERKLRGHGGSMLSKSSMRRRTAERLPRQGKDVDIYFSYYRDKSGEFLERINAGNVVKSQVLELLKLARSDTSPKKLAEQALLSSFHELAEEEWEKLKSRSREPKVDIGSGSHPYLFGWLSCCGQKPFELITQVSIYEARSLISALNRELYEPNPRIVIKRVCTIRFLISCHLIASKVDTYDQRIVDSLAEGIRSGKSPAFGLLREAEEAACRLSRREKGFNLKDDAITIMHCIGQAIATININLNDVFNEERSSDRGFVRAARKNKQSSESSVTHIITMYFNDEPGTYYKIADAMKSKVVFNIIASRSETLLPGKLAFAELKISSHVRNIEQMLKDAIVDEGLTAKIIDIIAEDMKIS